MEIIESGRGPNVTQTLAIALIIISVIAAWWDVRHQRIPNWLTISALVLAFALRSAAGLGSVTAGILGAGLAFGLALPFFSVGGLGGGDVKLLAAVGAFLGPAQLALALVVMAVVGGLMAVVAIARRRAYRRTLLNLRTILSTGLGGKRRGKGSLVLPTIRSPDALTIPYGVAIAVGATAGAIAALGVVS